MISLEGKTALVTGGRQGIGRAIVERFVDAGAIVWTCGRGARPADLPAEILWHTADVGNTSDVESLQQAILNQGPLHVLVNNAGIQIEKTVVETSDQDWDRIMNVNAKGVFLVCRAMIPHMRAPASIINIGSISGKVADHGMAVYNASKAFVHGLTRSIAIDHGPSIRSNAICPGWIMTDMVEAAFALAHDPDAAKHDALSRHATGRFGHPQDVAALALWLASDESSFATGQCYSIDGGLTAASPLNPGLF